MAESFSKIISNNLPELERLLLEVSEFLEQANLPLKSQAVELTLEELITNTVKHAGASNIHVYVGAAENNLIIDYRDDGKGMPVTAEINKGRGLLNIESRLQIVKGSYTSSSTGGYNIRICISMPVNQH